MNYIGSKLRLAPWIKSVIETVYKGNTKEAVFADVFAGTGQVSNYLKNDFQKVIVNDWELYSFYLNAHYIGNSKKLDEPSISIKKKEGYHL